MKTNMVATLAPGWSCLGLLMIALLSGCGGGTGNISGQVSVDGKPLPSGKVCFICEGGDKPVLTSDIRNGAYSIQNAPVGPARITVATFKFTFTPVPNMPKTGISPPGGDASADAGQFVPIPSRYNDPAQSGLTHTITAGDQVNDLQLSVK